MINKPYRPGAVGALLDIYEQAISDFKAVIEDIPDGMLTVITDPVTADENCRSVQTILTHVVSSGFNYATSIDRLKGHTVETKSKVFHQTIEAYVHDLTNVFAYTEKVFSSIEDNELEQFDDSLKIKARWGQVYDIEQMTEHAIVHILRHKRQLEKIKLRFRSDA
ncbi:hypothetical protein SAMN04488128_104209 [Chitinophaga eiseniae]|uniref:DinB family protein n=1 Tax=Chitinophaga eiseniae TaxID=634771 RepID=A0A1T4T9R4_9BACT|nr:damage-inducible protein DinB [Chitinophaga eiseniae]SKA37019.1 hypothetical protein SAMN04488128_104209 [Chitinophaga eiseniae]